jgi:DnaJ-class molecular chaperone
MATDQPPTDVPCSACRGTGKVISRLGGEPSEVVCPWCEGRGLRLASDHDAQKVHNGDDEPPDQAA